jgi:hypothetical protein
MSTNRKSLVERLFLCKRPLRLMLLELSKMSQKMARMKLLRINHGEAYGLVDFTEMQMNHLQEIAERFQAFEEMVAEMTSTACRAHLIEEGFSPDKYPEEMEYYMRQLEIPIHERGKTYNFDHPSGEEDYPGQWLVYSQQRKKRQVCKRLADFIRLVDYMVQMTYHKLMKNSIFILMLEMHSRLQFTPESYILEFNEEKAFEDVKERVVRFVSCDIYFILNPIVATFRT